MKKVRYCSKCGKYTGKNGNLCIDCSLKSNQKMSEPDMTGSFDAIQEICEGNFNIRLKEGFRLLSEE